MRYSLLVPRMPFPLAIRRSGFRKRQFADIARVRRVRDKGKRLDRPLRRQHRHHRRRIAAAQHLAAPQDRGLSMDGIRGDTERQSPATSLLRLQRKHQRRIVMRSPAEIDLQREAALKALDVGEPDFGEMKSRVPHQRAVAIDPEVRARFVIAEHRKPRRLDHLVRQPPAGGPSRGPRTLLPHREHLGRQAQQRFFGMRYPGSKLGQMNECVRGQGGMPLW